MTPNELKTRLLQALSSADFHSDSDDIVQDLAASGAGLESVRVVLEFMEEHPDVEFGSPGPLVHFVEKFYRAGYEDELLASLSRRPSMHTAWMLNRVINGVKNPDDRARLVDAMRAVGQHALANEQTREAAAHYLERLSELGSGKSS